MSNLCSTAEYSALEKLPFGLKDRKTRQPRMTDPARPFSAGFHAYSDEVRRVFAERLPGMFRVYLSVSPEVARRLEEGLYDDTVIEAHLHPSHVRRLHNECVLTIAVRPAHVLAVLDPGTSRILLTSRDLYSELVNAEYVR